MLAIRPARKAATYLRRLARDQSGAIVVLVGLLLIPLMLGVGLVIDGGLLLFEHRGVRNGADAATLAAMRELWIGNDTSDPASPLSVTCDDPSIGTGARPAADAACAVATSAPYNYDPTEVTVNMPPVVSSIYGGAAHHVEVVITTQYNTLLIGLVGADQVTVRGRAVGGAAPKAIEAGATVDGLIDEEYGPPIAAGNCVDAQGNPTSDPALDEEGFPTNECNEVYSVLDDDWVYIALKVNQASNDNRFGPKQKDQDNLDADCVDEYADDASCSPDDWDYYWNPPIGDEDGTPGQAWRKEKHDFKALHKSDAFVVELRCAGVTEQMFPLDYLYDDGGVWHSGEQGSDDVMKDNPPWFSNPSLLDSAPDSHNPGDGTDVDGDGHADGKAASSLMWNLNNSSWNVEIDDADDKYWRSPGNGEHAVFDWDTAPDGWEYRMIYEFQIPRTKYSSCLSDITLVVPESHNSPSKCPEGKNCPFVTAPIEHVGMVPRLRE